MITIKSLLTIPTVVASVMLHSIGGKAETLLFHATAAGRQALDQDESGGNPFASALIEQLSKRRVTLSEFPIALRDMTTAKAAKLAFVQIPDVPVMVVDKSWPVVPRKPKESRIALILVVTDYRKSDGLPSLPGAKFDADRLESALNKAGFRTRAVVDQSVDAMRSTLDDFASNSKQADVALIYTTGHGVEVDGNIYLLPGNYPAREKNSALNWHAVKLTQISQAAQAKKLNFIFYGGCRDNPLGSQ